MLVQEEGRLKKMKDHSIHLTFEREANCSKTKVGKKKKYKAPMKVNDGKVRKEYKCFFCKRTGHFKKDCPKRKAWFEKKGTYYVSVCFESDLIEVPNKAWWLDSGATTHVSDVIQGFLSIQPINETEQFLYIRNKMPEPRIPVAGIPTQ